MILHVNARCRHFYTTRNSIAFRLARLAPTTGGLILSNLQSHFRRTQEFFSAQEKVPFAFTAGRPFTYIYIGKNPRCCLILLGEWGDEKEKCVQRRVCTSRAWPFSLKRSSCVCVCWSRPDRFYMAAFDRTEALWVIRSRGRFFPVYSCCSRVKTKRNKTKNCEIRNIKKGFSLSAWRRAFRPFHHVPPGRIGIEGAVWGVLVPHLRRQCHSIWFCNENERERERDECKEAQKEEGVVWFGRADASLVCLRTQHSAAAGSINNVCCFYSSLSRSLLSIVEKERIQ